MLCVVVTALLAIPLAGMVQAEAKTMRNEDYSQAGVQGLLNELVLAEMFLMQATLESAGAIGSALAELGEGERPVADLLWDTADQAYDAYASRFRLLRQMRDSEQQ